MKNEIITTNDGSVFIQSFLKYTKKLVKKGDFNFFIDELIEILINNKIKFHNDFVLAHILDDIDWDNFTYYKTDELAALLQERYFFNVQEQYWTVSLLSKLIKKEAYPFLIEVVRSDVKFHTRAKAMKNLALLSKQPFDKNWPKTERCWKEKDLRIAEMEAWIKAGCPDGEGYQPPNLDKALENPTNEFEEVVAKLNNKLKKEQDTSDYSSYENFLVVAEESAINQLKNKYHLQGVYLEFLTRFSPCNVMIEKGMYETYLYGADNLEERQIGYSVSEQGEPLEGWPKNYLVIADRFADPYCIDTTQEDSCVYFANHGEGEWKFKKKYKNFQEFLSYLAK